MCVRWIPSIVVLVLVYLFAVVAAFGTAQRQVMGPDLVFTEFTLVPSPPVLGTHVLVRIGVYNQGDTVSEPVTLEWWGGEGFTHPSCTWRVDGLVPRGGQIYECTWFYSSWYGMIVTKAVVDPTDEVPEASEQNNTVSVPISVLERGQPRRVGARRR